MVINMSLSSECNSEAMNSAVASARDSGIIVVVAAANYNSNTCNYSPVCGHYCGSNWLKVLLYSL